MKQISRVKSLVDSGSQKYLHLQSDCSFPKYVGNMKLFVSGYRNKVCEEGFT